MAPVQDSDVETGESRAFLDFALAEPTGLLGSAIATHVRPLVATRWASDPFALGSYSTALPGHAGSRAVLAA